MRSTTASLAAAALALLVAGVAPAGAQTDSTGGTTGKMTTTPEAKSDDAVGTGGTEVQPSPAATTEGTAAEHGCAATQTWDAQKMACVEQ
ncbi:MAG TPA: hypothetical protein VFY87_13525 [Geminicoccaceae bacterium]|nr:hypothetical protein [Geminicoccaceae bacterium]